MKKKKEKNFKEFLVIIFVVFLSHKKAPVSSTNPHFFPDCLVCQS